MSRSNPLAVESLFNNNRMTEIPPYKLMCGLKMPKMNNMAQKADSYWQYAVKHSHLNIKLGTWIQYN